MPAIPLYIRAILAVIGFVATLGALTVTEGWLVIAFSGVGVLGFTTSIDWKHPVTSAVATVLTAAPLTVGLITFMNLNGVDTNVQNIVAVCVIVLFIFIGFFAGALAGYSFRTVPKSRLVISTVGALLTCGFVFASLQQTRSEERIWAPEQFPHTFTDMPFKTT